MKWAGLKSHLKSHSPTKHEEETEEEEEVGVVEEEEWIHSINLSSFLQQAPPTTVHIGCPSNSREMLQKLRDHTCHHVLCQHTSRVEADVSCSGDTSLAGFCGEAGLVEAQGVMDKLVLLTCLDHTTSV